MELERKSCDKRVSFIYNRSQPCILIQYDKSPRSKAETALACHIHFGSTFLNSLPCNSRFATPVVNIDKLNDSVRGSNSHCGLSKI